MTLKLLYSYLSSWVHSVYPSVGTRVGVLVDVLILYKRARCWLNVKEEKREPPCEILRFVVTVDPRYSESVRVELVE